MRNKKVLLTLISVLTAIFMIFALNFSVYATTEPTVYDEVVEETEAVYVPEETQAVQEPEYDFEEEEEDDDSGYVEQTDAPTQPPTYYQAHSDELPQVESQEIVAPTTVELPDVEVSDTSLLGGVIAWLCVAVGIAVIAGVLVSQRTRQTNSSPRRK